MALLLAVSFALALAARPSPSAPPPSPVASPVSGEPVILFLIDNSASLPPLDPDEKRVAALEKMFTFLQGNPYRLILFGGRKEVFVDDVSRYRNTGLWTDYYWAFQRARDLMKEYPPGTEFRMVLFTDAILDPSPEDWAGVERPATVDLRRYAGDRVVELLKEMGVPLYVILVGDAPSERTTELPERAPGLVRDMIQAANGARAT